MKESGRNLGKFIRGGVAGVALFTLSAVACEQQTQTVPITNSNENPNPTLKGDDFEIRRIGATNIFLLSGSDKESGIIYIDQGCEINAVGMWDFSDAYGNVDDVAVTVSNGECLTK